MKGKNVEKRELKPKKSLTLVAREIIIKIKQKSTKNSYESEREKEVQTKKRMLIMKCVRWENIQNRNKNNGKKRNR